MKKSKMWGIASKTKTKVLDKFEGNFNCESFELIEEDDFDEFTIVFPADISRMLSKFKKLEMRPVGFQIVSNKRCYYDMRAVYFSFKLGNDVLREDLENIISFTEYAENQEIGLHYSFFHNIDEDSVVEKDLYILEFHLMDSDSNFHIKNNPITCKWILRYMNFYKNLSDSVKYIEEDLKELKKIYKRYKKEGGYTL